MNGTVTFGVALIIVGLATGGRFFLPLLVGGVLVAGVGAFLQPGKSPAVPKRPPREDDPWV